MLVACLVGWQTQVTYLTKELRRPRFRQYHVVFSNSISDALLQEVASSDLQHLVQSVKEIYADFVACDAHLFNLNQLQVRDKGTDAWLPAALLRVTQGLHAVCAGLNLQPVVRFQASSQMCRALAGKLAAQPASSKMAQEVCTVLLLDRRADPVTPLLNQWTYQAMVHELVGIENNRVELASAAGSASADISAVVLSSEDDDFFRQQMYVSYGELLPAVSRLGDEYKKSKQGQKLQTLEEMKQFIKNYAQHKAVSSNAGRHVATVLQLKHLCEQHSLLGEDGIACLEADMVAKSASPAAIFKRVQHSLSVRHVRDLDKVRLVLLFAARFGHAHAGRLASLVDALTQASVAPSLCASVQQFMSYMGPQAAPALEVLCTDLYKPEAELASDLLQHTPLLSTVSDCH